MKFFKHTLNQSVKIKVFVLALAALTCVSEARAQKIVKTMAQPQQQQLASSENEVVMRSLARARALAAIGKLAAAASELESLSASISDESVRDVARVLLMSIFVEMPDYGRATALLNEAFGARKPGRAGDAATVSYFALAGQTINSVRAHLDRYRIFGLNIADGELPPEAQGDLEQLRHLVERVVEHAKGIGAEQGGADSSRGTDATALLEDAATVRMRIARGTEDRTKWQSEVSIARQRLFASETRIASISQIPTGAPPPEASPSPAAPSSSSSSSSAAKSSPANVQTKVAQKSAANSRTSGQKQSQQTASASNATNGEKSADESSAPSVVSIGSLAGAARQRVSPNYPQIAKTARITGVVTVFMTVDEKGEVVSVDSADGPVQLQQAAMDAARRWKFHPTVINGKAVSVKGFLSFNFTL